MEALSRQRPIRTPQVPQDPHRPWQAFWLAQVSPLAR